MQSPDPENTTRSSGIKQTVRIIGRHIVFWLSCEMLSWSYECVHISEI